MDQPRARALLAVDQLLRARWAALQRAEARLAAGSYGRSVRSGQAIPDERLEADPLAELTVQEAAATERSTVEEADDGVGLVSASHPFEVLADADITPEEEQASEENDDEPAPTAEPGHPHRARPAAPVAGSAASLRYGHHSSRCSSRDCLWTAGNPPPDLPSGAASDHKSNICLLSWSFSRTLLCWVKARAGL
jgi:hypothetical protein